MNWTFIGLAALFVIYDIIALGAIYTSYGKLKYFHRQNTGRGCSTFEKMFFAGFSMIVGILWLPLAILSLIASKL